jgi:hypothetical protein
LWQWLRSLWRYWLSRHPSRTRSAPRRGFPPQSRSEVTRRLKRRASRPPPSDTSGRPAARSRRTGVWPGSPASRRRSCACAHRNDTPFGVQGGEQWADRLRPSRCPVSRATRFAVDWWSPFGLAPGWPSSCGGPSAGKRDGAAVAIRPSRVGAPPEPSEPTVLRPSQRPRRPAASSVCPAVCCSR